MTAQARLPSESRINPEDAARSHRIRQGILAAGNALRERHPWLEKHQNAIGMAIFWVSIAGIIGSAWAYYSGLWPSKCWHITLMRPHAMWPAGWGRSQSI